jgi:hypothetical protein
MPRVKGWENCGVELRGRYRLLMRLRAAIDSLGPLTMINER